MFHGPVETKSPWITLWMSQYCYFLMELWVSERNTSDVGGDVSSMMEVWNDAGMKQCQEWLKEPVELPSVV